MQRLLKILLAFFIILLYTLNFCNAIDLNLTENATRNSSTNSENSSNNGSNKISNISDNTYGNATLDNTISQSTTVSSVSPTSNSQSSIIGNILDISLIVVGILLIFLAIAILIRLKK